MKQLTLTIAFVLLLASYAVAAQRETIYKISPDFSTIQMNSRNRFIVKPFDRKVVKMWMSGNKIKISPWKDKVWSFLLVNSTMGGKVRARLVRP